MAGNFIIDANLQAIIDTAIAQYVHKNHPRPNQRGPPVPIVLPGPLGHGTMAPDVLP